MKKFVIVILLFVVTLSVNAQLVVNSGVLTPTQYVQNVLVGSGITVSNVNYYGHPTQIGTFNGVASTIGLDSGLVLSTGEVSTNQLGGFPDTDIDFTYGPAANLGGGDPDLLTVAQSVITNPQAATIISTHDMAMIEFDFIPTGDTVKFNFVFASEEYTAFINSSFNDVFGFFISGPGLAGPYASPGGFPNGSVNIALVPNTNLPITISTIYSDPFQVPPTFNAQYYIDNAASNTHELNGFTTVLTAISAVQCGQLYHMKLAVADAQDGILDTDVFLEASSFSSNIVSLSSSIDVANGDSILYEGCGTAFLDFVRPDTTDTAVYNFNIIGTAGTADYSISADSVLFLPGQDTVTLSFNAIQDGLTEPLETVVIQLIQIICNVPDTQIIIFYISDYPLPVLTMHDTLKNCGSTDSVPIWVNILGPPHTILWSTGDTTDTVWVNPVATTTYYVTVSDTCGVYAITDSATVTIVIPSPIVLNTLNDTAKYCPQDSMLIYVTASGGGGGYTYSWSPGGTTDSSLFVSPGVTTTYIVAVTDLCGSTVQDSVTITVPNYIPLTNLITTNDTTICSGDLVALNAIINGGVGSYFTWNNGLGNVLPVNVNPITTTNYILTAQDSCGAIATDSVLVSITPINYQLNLPDSINLDCLNETSVLDPTITGGNGTETYLWSTSEITSTIQVLPLVTTTYIVAVSDACSTSLDSTKVVVPVFAPLLLNVNNNSNLNCPGEQVVLSANFVGGAQNTLVFNWSDGTNNFTGNNIAVNPLTTTTYTAWVNDTCAFDGDTTSFTVTVPNYPPLQLIVSNDTLICVGDFANLITTVSGGEGTYTYNWSNGSSSNYIQVSPVFSTNYTIVATDGCGQSLSETILVEATAATAGFSYEYTGEYTVQFTDSSYDNIVSYWWTFDADGTYSSQDPVYTFGFDGAHNVMLLVQDINGCYDTIQKVIKPPLFVYGPNSFTPDGDGINDVFKFKGMGIEHFELLIFSRWGELLFTAEHIDIGWNGSYKGKLLPVGTYVYKVRAESYEKRVFEKAGSVNLIR